MVRNETVFTKVEVDRTLRLILDRLRKVFSTYKPEEVDALCDGMFESWQAMRLEFEAASNHPHFVMAMYLYAREELQAQGALGEKVRVALDTIHEAIVCKGLD